MEKQNNVKVFYITTFLWYFVRWMMFLCTWTETCCNQPYNIPITALTDSYYPLDLYRSHDSTDSSYEELVRVFNQYHTMLLADFNAKSGTEPNRNWKAYQRKMLFHPSSFLSLNIIT